MWVILPQEDEDFVDARCIPDPPIGFRVGEVASYHNDDGNQYLVIWGVEPQSEVKFPENARRVLLLRVTEADWLRAGWWVLSASLCERTETGWDCHPVDMLVGLWYWKVYPPEDFPSYEERKAAERWYLALSDKFRCEEENCDGYDCYGRWEYELQIFPMVVYKFRGGGE